MLLHVCTANVDRWTPGPTAIELLLKENKQGHRTFLGQLILQECVFY